MQAVSIKVLSIGVHYKCNNNLYDNQKAKFADYFVYSETSVYIAVIGDNKMTLYRNLDQKTLDAMYDNTLVVPDFRATLNKMQELSKETYSRHPDVQKNIKYGPLDRNTIDFFPAVQHSANTAPLYIFIHGGYWHACAKEDFGFIAKGPNSLGYHVALIEYTLTPQVTMTELVSEVRCALDFLQQNASRFQVDTSHVCLSGHSAGGHLTAMHRDHPFITYALPISPLVDMVPMKLSWLNKTIQLTDDEIENLSPLYHIKKDIPTDVVVGAAELPGLLSHAYEYYLALKAVGNETAYITPKGLTHFTVLDAIADLDPEIEAAFKKHLG